MNTHKNARLAVIGRMLLVERIEEIGLIPAAEAAGISTRTRSLLTGTLCARSCAQMRGQP